MNNKEAIEIIKDFLNQDSFDHKSVVAALDHAINQLEKSEVWDEPEEMEVWDRINGNRINIGIEKVHGLFKGRYCVVNNVGIPICFYQYATSIKKEPLKFEDWLLEFHDINVNGYFVAWKDAIKLREKWEKYCEGFKDKSL